MVIMNKEIEDKNIFKFLLFIWIMSIPFKNAVYQISVSLIVVFFTIHLFNTKRFDVLIDNFNKTKYLTIGFVSIILSMILANYLNLELLDKKSWHLIYMFVIRYGLIFVILAYFYKLNFFNKKEIVISILISFLLLLSTGIYQIVQDPSILTGSGIMGSLNNRNGFGLFMGMGFILSLILIEDKKNLALFLILIFSFFMIFSFSRSSWVASAISSLIFFSLNYKKIKINHFVYLFLFLGFLLILYFSFDSLQLRFKQLVEGHSSNRTTIWLHTITFIKEQIFYGYGIDSWMNLPDEYLNRYKDPHNVVLEILISTGLFGFMSYLFTVIVVLTKVFTSKEYILFPIAAYFLVVTQFDFGAFTSKELLSFLTIFIFFVYSNDFKKNKSI